ncbi:Brix-domain-containing protein [Ramaria rubella]|nr:Brix-domain-containing protein [Ramaria rubella]
MAALASGVAFTYGAFYENQKQNKTARCLQCIEKAADTGKAQKATRNVRRGKERPHEKEGVVIYLIAVTDTKTQQKRLAENVPRTLDNTREFDPSILTANPAVPSSSTTPPEEPSSSSAPQPDSEVLLDISTDPFAPYFSSSSTDAPSTPKVLITTCQKATRVSYDFCEEIVDVFPGAEFVRRKKGQGFEIGRIAGWAAKRGYGSLMVVNEDRKKPNAITIVHLPSGPTAYFKLSSIQLTKEIYGHARATAHAPELVLNNFVTRLGHTVGRMFQTLFPPLPEFQGRQVVTLHNQRDFLFFRRHRYAFRSTEKAALQEIGPRFTLKLRWLKKGVPSVGDVFGSGEHPPALEVNVVDENEDAEAGGTERHDREGGSTEDGAIGATKSQKVGHTKGGMDEYEWMWKPELETTRRTFFL